MNEIYANERPGAWICVLGLVICLLGCQPQAYQTSSLPPPPAASAPRPQPVRPTFYVNIKQLTLRACPDKGCNKISTLELNAEVEKMGEIKNWTQIKVKKDGTIGYVVSRYLSPQRVEIAHLAKKKLKKAKPRKAAPPSEAVAEAEKTEPKQQEPSPPLPRVM